MATNPETTQDEINPTAADPLFDRVVQAESGGVHRNPDGSLLRSPKGALGVSQLMPATAANPGFGVEPAKDDSEEEYRRVGSDYLDAMVDRYGGDERKGVAAYNAGPGAVDAAIKKRGDKWLDALPAETQAYVEKVAGVPSAAAPPYRGSDTGTPSAPTPQGTIPGYRPFTPVPVAGAAPADKSSHLVRDTALAAAAGAAAIPQVAGQALSWAGRKLGIKPVEEAGEWTKTMSEGWPDYWTKSMAPENKQALDSPIIKDDLSLGPTPIRSLFLQTAEMVPSLVAMGGVSGAAMKGFEAVQAAARFGRFLTASGVPEAVAQRLATNVVRGVAINGGPGVYMGLQAAAAKEKEAESLPDDVKDQSEVFRQAYADTDPSLPIARRRELASEEFGKQVGDYIFPRVAGYWTATGAALSPVTARLAAPYGAGLARRVAQGAAVGAPLFAAQMAGSQAIENEAAGKPLTEGMANAALSGAAMGAVFHGAGAPTRGAPETVHPGEGARPSGEAAIEPGAKQPLELVPKEEAAAPEPAKAAAPGMQEGDVGRPKDGQPFAAKIAAFGVRARQGLADSHDVAQIGPDQWVLRPKAPAAEMEAASVETKAPESETLPPQTEAQAEKPATKEQVVAGNAALDHRQLGPFDLSLENRAGTMRTDLKHEPPEWETKMTADYGYARGTVGYDKDHLDFYTKAGTPDDYDGPVFVVDQRKPGNGNFDEHKVMAGWKNLSAAKKAYLSHYEEGWQGLKSITPSTLDEVKAWSDAGGPKKGPFADWKAKEGAKPPEQAEFDRQNQANLVRKRGTPWEKSREFDTTLDDGRTVQVKYESPEDAIGGSTGGVHFEFRGEATSPTGYRSDFQHSEVTDKVETPELFAKQRAEELAAENAKGAVQRARREKRAAKARGAAPEPTSEKPASEEAGKPEATAPGDRDATYRPLVEAIIKRFAAAKENNRSIDGPKNRAKEIMRGEREPTKAEAAWFEKQAVMYDKLKDKGTASAIRAVANAITEGLPPAKPAERSAKQLARDEQLRRIAAGNARIDEHVDSLIPAIVKAGGLKDKERIEITGEHGAASTNPRVPFLGALFGKGKRALGIDEMAQRLGPDNSRHYMTREEIDSVDGGVTALRDKIRDELAGNKHYSSVYEPERAAEEFTHEVGEDTLTPAAEHATGIDNLKPESQVLAHEVADDKLDAVAAGPGVIHDDDWSKLSASERDAELEAAFGKAESHEQGSRGEAGEAAAVGAEEGARGGAQAGEGAAGEPARPDLALTSETEEERRKREAAVADAAAKKEAADKAAEAKEAADREPFIMTGSDRPADQLGARGQIDLLSPEAKPAGYGTKNTLFTAEDAEKARAILRKKFGQVSAGIDPETMQAGLTLGGYHLEAGAREFGKWAKAMIEDMGEAIRPYLKSVYNALRDYPGVDETGMTPYEEVRAHKFEEANAERGGTDLESNRPTGPAADRPWSEVLPPEPRPADGGHAEGGRAAGGEGGGSRSGERVPGAGAAGSREGSDRPLLAPESNDSRGTAGDHESAGGADNGRPVVSPQRDPDKAVARTARESDAALRERQRVASKLPVKTGDLDNIRETLPVLHEGQQDDVLFAENRFAKDDGHGVMFTNATGTGKTFTGLGIAKRFAQAGKDNILVIAPNDKILQDWSNRAQRVDMPLKRLESTNDNGRKGPVATTYANFGTNDTLAKRKWDLVIADEAHYLSANEKGDLTNAGETLQAITGHPQGVWKKAQMLRPDLSEAAANAAREVRKLRGAYGSPQYLAAKERSDKAQAAWSEHVDKVKEEHATAPRPKVVFMSATPFAYQKSIEYAHGYLFDYGPEPESRGYNTPDARQQFYVQHFGYRMRYGKLTEPEAAVERSIMEVQFNNWLNEQGVLSSRLLDVDHDYERKFALVDQGIGKLIDDGMDFLSSAEDGKYRPLFNALNANFKYHDRMFLLEAIKAKAAVDLAQEHLDLGRKVVVFHDFNKGGGFHPFQFAETGDPKVDRLIPEFEAARPDLVNADFSNLKSPLHAFRERFGDDAMFFNGTVSKGQRLDAVGAFNDDESGRNLLVAQSDAAREGISLHDETGKHQRVLINLGMPVKPTASIQTEGRIYRFGQASDAVFLYLNTGTNFERYTFANKIAERASTAENLAVGEQARALRQSFVDAFGNAIEDYKPSQDEGTGGKAADRAQQGTITDFQKAKTYYFSNQKKTARQKSAEGRDYFATPEPLGQKMVQWAGINAGDKVLEPSAGHGAIARFIPETADATIIEPSVELGSRAALVSGAHLVVDSFENHHIVNKYNAILMNPPFGSGGKTAWDHVAKAFDHLADRGRVLAIVPDGPAAEKQYEKFMENTKGVHQVAEVKLPAVTFERAATSVRTKLMVFDRYLNPKEAPAEPGVTRDLSDIDSIKDFFNRIEFMDLPERDTSVPAAPEKRPAAGVAEPTAEGIMSPAQTTHSRTGEDLFVAKFNQRVDTDRYNALKALAKQNGGWYSAFRGSGAIPGFQFRDQASRDKFLAAAKAQSVGEEPTEYNAAHEPAGETSDVRGAPTEAREVAGVRRTPGGLRNIALGIAATFKREKATALIGQHVRTADDLADLAQIYRDPRNETFRVFYTKGDTIVHATGVSSRQAGVSEIFPTHVQGDAARIEWMKDQMRRVGADGYWLLHNHPSGSAKPSLADFMLTRDLESAVLGFRGHVIIDSNEYAVIHQADRVAGPDLRGGASIISWPYGEDMLLRPSRPHPVLGQDIGTPEDAAKVGRQLQQPGYITLVGSNKGGGVRAVSDIPVSSMITPARAAAAAARFSRLTGSGSVFLYGAHEDVAKINAGRPEDLVRNGHVRDVQDDLGTSHLRELIRENPNVEDEITKPRRVGRQVEEEALPYDATPGKDRDEARGRFGYSPYVGVEQTERPRSPVGDALAKIFAPATRGEAAAQQAGIMRHNLARAAQLREVALEKFKDHAKIFDAMPLDQVHKFIDDYEHGVAPANPKLAAIAADIKAFNTERRQMVQALGKGQLQNFNENYLGRIWQDPKKAGAFYAGLRRPLEGSKGFLKQRTFDYFGEGLAAGLKPITENPIEMMLLKGREVDRYVYGQKIFAEMKDAGLAKFVRFGSQAPEGWVKINDKIARVLQYSEGERGFVMRGDYYAPDGAATLINNHLSPGLQGNGAYDVFRKTGLMLNSAQLGMSAFHAGFTTLDTMVSKAALGVQQISRGDVAKGVGSVLQSMNPAQPLLNWYKGDRLLKAYLGKLQDPGLAPIVEAMLHGGARVRMDDFYRNASVNAFRQGLRRGDYWQAGKNLLPTLLDRANAPIFEYLVPRQKLGVFFDMAKDYLERNPNATLDERRRDLGKLWDSVDNRLGQLTYDNVFWNRTLKDALMVGVRSVGWNLGTFRELGGGVLDVKNILRDKELSSRTAYALALPFVAAVLGSVTGYLYTGNGPDDLKDMFFPRTGKKRPDGSDDRVSLPTYMKDVYEYGHDISGFLRYGADPTSTLKNKMHPLLGMISQMLNNEDFFGAAIRNPGDPVMQQLQDEAEYLGKQMQPFGVRNYRMRSKVEGEEPTPEGYVTSPSFFGVVPAPGYITKSPEQTESAAAAKMRDALVSKFRQEIRDGADVTETRQRMRAAGLRPNEIQMAVSQGLRTTYTPHRLRQFGSPSGAETSPD